MIPGVLRLVFVLLIGFLSLAQDASGQRQIVVRPARVISAHQQFNHSRDEDPFGPSITDLSFSAKGWLLSSGTDRTVRVWDPGYGTSIALFPNLRQQVYCIAFSNDSSIIARGGRYDYEVPKTSVGDGPLRRTEGCVDMINFFRGEFAGSIILDRGAASDVAFSKDDKYVLVGTTEGTCELWRTFGDLLSRFDVARERILKHSRSDDPVTVAFSAEGKAFVTAGQTGIRLWNVTESEPLTTFRGESPAVFSPNGELLAFHARSDPRGRRSIIIWDVHKEERKTVLVPDWSLLEELAPGASSDNAWPLLPHRTGGIAFSPDGRLLAQGHSQFASVWDLEANQVVAILGGHDPARGPVSSIAFGPRGDVVSTAQHGSTSIAVFDLSEMVKPSEQDPVD